MPLLTASTEDVIKLIKFAKLTTYSGKDDPTMSSIVLYTVEGQVGEDVGGDTVLVALSSDGVIAGQYAIPVTGTLAKPVVIPATDTAWLATMLATDLRQHKGADTSVNLDFDTSAGVFKVRAVADGIEESQDRRGVLGLDISGSYPLDSVKDLLKYDPQNSGPHEWVRASIPGGYLSILAAASKMSASPADIYPTSGESKGLVAFLPGWRAVFPYGACREYGETVTNDEWALPAASEADKDELAEDQV